MSVQATIRRKSAPDIRALAWEPIENNARAIAEAGAFSAVLEAKAEPLVRNITQSVSIPTIAIGASAACDDQVQVLEDMLECRRVRRNSFAVMAIWDLRSRRPSRPMRPTCARAAFWARNMSTA